MAAPDMTVSYAGQVNGAGTADALWLKVFGGEVLTAFREANLFGPRTMMRSITSGKSASFPASWKAVASYHTPGTMITGQVINGNERVIVIDDLLISPVFIASIDEAKAHWEFRREYSSQCGFALGKAMDKNIGQVMALAARAATTVTGGNGGTQIISATSKTNADALMAALADAAQALDEKDVPKEGRAAYLLPDQWYLLVNSGSRTINRDYNPQGNGSVASGEMFKAFGLELVQTNHLPSTNVATGPAAYQGNFVNTSCVVGHRSSVGTVKLLDLAVESAYLIQNQGTLVVAKYAIGHGILRPESAVEIVTA
jgi:hypothetical protein